MSYVLEVRETDGELSLNLPEEIHAELGWIDGDLIEWNVKGPGLLLNRLNEPFEVEINEEQNIKNSHRKRTMFYSGMMGAMGGGLGNAGALLGGKAGQDVAGLFKKRMQEGQAAAPMPGMGATPGAFLGSQMGNVAGISFDINESPKNRKMR